MVVYTSQMFVDESGTARHTPYIVYGALKMSSDLGLVVNDLEYLRSSTGIRDEAKFSQTNKSTLGFHRQIVDIIQASKSRFSAVIGSRSKEKKGLPQWQSQAYYTIEALKLAISGDERTAAIVDHVSVPREVNFESYIHKAVNHPYGEDDRRLISVVRMASEACWGLQVADLLTGAVHFAHRLDNGDTSLNPESPRGQLAEHVRHAYNVSSFEPSQGT